MYSTFCWLVISFALFGACSFEILDLGSRNNSKGAHLLEVSPLHLEGSISLLFAAKNLLETSTAFSKVFCFISLFFFCGSPAISTSLGGCVSSSHLLFLRISVFSSAFTGTAAVLAKIAEVLTAVQYFLGESSWRDCSLC